MLIARLLVPNFSVSGIIPLTIAIPRQEGDYPFVGWNRPERAALRAGIDVLARPDASSVVLDYARSVSPTSRLSPNSPLSLFFSAGILSKSAG